nr:MAG TPA: hypothetical protein [Bacteriophage sp.]
MSILAYLLTFYYLVNSGTILSINIDVEESL